MLKAHWNGFNVILENESEEIDIYEDESDIKVKFAISSELWNIIDILMLASEMSIMEGKHTEALLKLTNDINVPASSPISPLYVAVYSFIMNSLSDTLSEKNLSDAFFSNLDKHLPGAKRITNIRCMRDHIPDGFVEINDETIPVEIKAGDFDAKALLQLKRYIKEYDCRKGIAVARRLRCELPSNITFVCMGK